MPSGASSLRNGVPFPNPAASGGSWITALLTALRTTITSNRLWALLAVSLLAVTIGGGIIAWSRLRPGPPLDIWLPPEAPFKGRILIGGAVTSPGWYPFSGSDSIDDLVRAAGGPAGNADLSQLALEVATTGTEPQPQRVDINRAEPWLLEALPGIGETRAQAIVDYRREHGPFRNVDELADVPGIGAGVLEQIRPLVTVSD